MDSTRIRAALVVLLLAALLPTWAGAQPSDTVLVVKADERPDAAELAVRVAEATVDRAGTVLVSRDDVFADAMASGLLQGSGAPLLLTPSDGPLPDRVVEEVARLGATRAIVLGGAQAIDAGVVAELTDLGLDVERRQGASRLETAVDIASSDGGGATTAILVRAFADPAEADPSQAWADALATGGWSAETGWPILLTETDRLSIPTANQLVASGVTDVQLVGGTAAIGVAVEQQLEALGLRVERVAGANRFETAVAIAAKRGAASAADVAHIVLVEGGADPDGWVPAFTTAAASGAEMAPVVLVDEDEIPEATVAWLTAPPSEPGGGAYAQVGLDEGVRLLCVFYVAALCPQLRALLDLPQAAVTADPAPDAGAVQQGTTVQIVIEPVRGEIVAATATGCGVDVQLAVTGGAVVLEPSPSDPTCALLVTVSYAGPPDGPTPTQGFTLTYDVAG